MTVPVRADVNFSTVAIEVTAALTFGNGRAKQPEGVKISL